MECLDDQEWWHVIGWSGTGKTVVEFWRRGLLIGFMICCWARDKADIKKDRTETETENI